jgi:hypothetical protein
MFNHLRIIGCIHLALLAATVLLSGCSGRFGGSNLPPLVKVTGTVTYQGQPIEGADVTFNNVDAGYTAIGKTDASGRFLLATAGQEGVGVGKQVVAIRRVDVIDNTPAGVDVSAGGVASPPTIRWIVPEKYSVPSTAGLSAEVKTGSPNDFPFDLK